MNFDNWIENLRGKKWLQIFVIYTRYLIGGAFVFASIVKIKSERFFTAVENISDAPWHSVGNYFETMYQSGLYWNFLGWGQLIAGLLLLTQKYAKLGAIAFFPIILNVFVITISYDFHATPIITFFMMLASIMLLLWHWGELKILFNLPYSPSKVNTIEELPIWGIIGAIIFIFTVTLKVFYPSAIGIMFWITGATLLGLIGLFIGLKQSKKQDEEV